MENSRCRCAVRGSINHDEYFYVKDIVRPGETVSSHQYESRIGGKGANQAIAIARAGGEVDFYGTIGQDGSWIKDKLATFGLNDSGIFVSDVPTGRALIQLSNSGENSIILFPGANHSRLLEEKWTKNSTFPAATHLLLQNEIPMESIHYALNHSGEMTTIFNLSPLPTPDQIANFPWQKVDWLLVNEGEALGLYNAFIHSDTERSAPDTSETAFIRELIFGLSKQPSLSRTNIICTLGKDGVLAFISTFHRPRSQSSHNAPPEQFIYLPAAELQGTIRDTTGAGDCFTGYFVEGLMNLGAYAGLGTEILEEDVLQILKICVQAAGMCVEKQGTIDSIPTRAEVDARIMSTTK